MIGLFISFFFFFSSRRRHTRCSRDWSSDVCSSDLEAREPIAEPSSNRARISDPLHIARRTGCGWRREDACRGRLSVRQQPPRSEEHTSELQSRLHLVCRLLLEKKKNDRTLIRCCTPPSTVTTTRPL